MIHNHLRYASNILKKLIIMTIYPVRGNRWVAKPPEKTGYPTSNYRLFVAALGEFPERIGIEHNDSAVLEPNPFARGPNPQLLVDALPGHADHLANFLLRNGDRPPFGMMELAPCGQGEQRAGESARQIQQDDLFDLLAGPAQPRTEQLDEFHRKSRMASHEGQEVAAVNDEDFAFGICGGVGRPPLSGKHRNLAERLARTDQIEDRAAAFRRGDVIFTVPDITPKTLSPGSPFASAKCAWRNGRVGRVPQAQGRSRSDACARPISCCSILPGPETRRLELQKRSSQSASQP